MRDAVTLDEFIRMTGAPADRVTALVEHGLLDPDGDDRFDDVDVLRLIDLNHFLDRGCSVEELAAGIRDGSIEVMQGERLFAGEELLSVDAVAERTDFDIEQLRALLAALGVGLEYMVEADVELVQAMKLAQTVGLPYEGLLETARVIGDSLRRIADAEVRLIHVHMHERLLAEGVAETDINAQVFDIQNTLGHFLAPMLTRLHDVHMVNAAIEDALLHIGPTSAEGVAPGSVEVSIVFVDLASFTSMTETEGDEAAVRVLQRIETALRPLVLQYRGRVVKHTGDGFMLSFREADDAVRAAIDLRDALAEPGIPPMRAGVNTGMAVFRGGDYIGSTANIASRVTGAAMAGQILVTSTTVERIADPTLQFEEVGVRLLRGVDEPLALFRPVVEAAQRDPVCGKTLDGSTGMRLQHDGRDLAFCSDDCLRQYLAAPSAYR